MSICGCSRWPDATTVLVPDVALSRVALESEGLLVNSSQGGGSKDTWIGPV